MRKLDHASLQKLGCARRRALPAPAENGGTGARGLSPSLAVIHQEVERELGLRAGAGETAHIAGNSEIEMLVRQTAERLGFELSNWERDEILSSLEREQRPFGVLQELADDPQISDIIVSDSRKIVVQRGRRNFRTDLAFPSHEAYEAFVEKLLQKAGTTYSTRKPIADGMIGSFARVHAVHRSLCESGPYLTIRLNRFAEVGVSDLVEAGMAPQELFAYLQGMIQIGATLLIVGEVGTGKTTLARALAAAVPVDESILVIEDTPEIRLLHPHVRYISTREANSDGAGRVAPGECIRAGMRMAMNRIIFGEIRDAEAAEAFVDVCASGHPGLSTIHARSAADACTRLELFLGRSQRGVERRVLNEQIVTAVQAIVFLNICHETGKRRVMEVREIGPVADGVIRQRDIFRYEVCRSLPLWKVLNRVSAHRAALEALPQAVVLSGFPAQIESDLDQIYRDTAQRRCA